MSYILDDLSHKLWLISEHLNYQLFQFYLWHSLVINVLSYM